MKYAIPLTLGFMCGAMLLALGLYYNPFVGQPTITPLAMSDDRIIQLTFSAVPSDAILYTDQGETIITPHPDRVAELWEPAIADTRVLVTMLQNSTGNTAGLGIKMLSESEATDVIRGEAIANSIWHIYLPGLGTMLVDQSENYWSYIRDVVIPAHWNSADNWRGTFHHITTNGPGSLGTARVTGGSGLLAGMTSESVEALTAIGYSAVSGPVSMDGSLTIAIPEESTAQQ